MEAPKIPGGGCGALPVRNISSHAMPTICAITKIAIIPCQSLGIFSKRNFRSDQISHSTSPTNIALTMVRKNVTTLSV